jgi:hypothetical protein
MRRAIESLMVLHLGSGGCPNMAPEQNNEIGGTERDEGKPSIWDAREGMMSEEEVARLAEERGKGEEGRDRADQSGQRGPQEGADPSQRPAYEGGPRGDLLRKKAEEEEEEESTESDTKSDDWTKYDWS